VALSCCRIYVVQHEHAPLGGGEIIQHYEQRDVNRVGEQRLVLGVHPTLACLDRVGKTRVQVLLAPRGARAQHVQAYSRYDRRQPSSQVFDAACVGAVEP
jgi:hypothetical protein